MSAPSVVLTLPNLRLGGAQRQTVAIANGLSKSGFQCEIFALRGGELEREIDPEVKVTVPPAHGIFRLLLALKKEKPDVLYSRHWTKILNTAAGKLFGIKTVWTEGNSVEFLKRNRPLSFLAHRLFARHADCFTAISEGLADECVQMLGARPDVIYNGIDIGLVEKKSREPAPHPWIESEKPLVVAVGRLVKQKGFDTLIDAFETAHKQTGAHLLIVGGGKMRDRLRERIDALGLGDAVSLVGETANPYPFIAAADVFAQPSVYEGFGNTLLEAQALGVPCVSTDYRFAANEIIRDGENGLLVPVGDARKLADAIVRVIQNPGLADKLGKAAKQRAADFSAEKMTENYSRLFRDLLGENG